MSGHSVDDLATVLRGEIETRLESDKVRSDPQREALLTRQQIISGKLRSFESRLERLQTPTVPLLLTQIDHVRVKLILM
jgi:hypothetical protein